MNQDQIQQLFPAITALAGIIIGSIGTFVANKKIKQEELKHAREQELRIEKRTCCVNFISEANSLYIKAMNEKASSSNDFINITSHYTNIELLCSTSTINSAKEIFELILAKHSQIEKDNLPPYVDLRKALIKSIKDELKIYI